MRTRILVVLAGAVTAAATLASGATASHSWGNYHWARTANPFTLQVGDNVTGAWDSSLDRAIGDWDRSSVLTLVEVTGQAKGKCRPTSGRVEVCNGSYGFNGWLGIAQIWISGGVHITQATTRVNDSYFNTPTYNDPTKRQHVMCQEVGHDFGLGHQSESGADLNTCMDYATSLDNPSPNAHDYQQLESIYAHLDSFTTAGFADPGQAGTDAKPDKVERRDRIHDSTIEEHFADGSKKVTHIFWAVPGAPRNHDHDHED